MSARMRLVSEGTVTVVIWIDDDWLKFSKCSLPYKALAGLGYSRAPLLAPPDLRGYLGYPAASCQFKDDRRTHIIPTNGFAKLKIAVEDDPRRGSRESVRPPALQTIGPEDPTRWFRRSTLFVSLKHFMRLPWLARYECLRQKS
jgi:hypothetical protein